MLIYFRTSILVTDVTCVDIIDYCAQDISLTMNSSINKCASVIYNIFKYGNRQ